jgi:hypothetical protein
VARLLAANSRLKLEKEKLKISGGVLREGIAVEYVGIQAHRERCSIPMMCVLLVSRSGLYQAMARTDAPDIERIVDKIRVAQRRHSPLENIDPVKFETRWRGCGERVIHCRPVSGSSQGTEPAVRG